MERDIHLSVFYNIDNHHTISPTTNRRAINALYQLVPNMIAMTIRTITIAAARMSSKTNHV